MDVGKLMESVLGGGGGSGSGGGGKSSGGGLSGLASHIPGGLAGGAAAGGLVALMLGNKKARKMGGKVLTYGGMAAAAGLAYKAYTHYRDDRQTSNAAASVDPVEAAAAPLPDPAFDPAQARDATGGDVRLLLLRAMIMAAKADGHIDAKEQETIRGEIDRLSLGAQEKGFLFDLMGQPADPLALARDARDEAQASEIYLVSLLAVDVDTPEERRYLERLGDALRLPDGLRQELTLQVAQAKEAAA